MSQTLFKTTTIQTAKPKHLIKDKTDRSNLGVILFNQSTIEEIQKNSGPIANKCEYQTHYWAIVIRATSQDGSILDICIPTVFFNYKQIVSGAHIDFEFADVDTMSEALEPVHNTIVNRLMGPNDIVAQILEYLPDSVTTKLLSTNLNSMHRHPGSPTSQRFSSTDLSTDHTHNTGIVFPLAEAKDGKPNFAGITAHAKEVNRVAHFEYRTAEGKVDPTADTAITYTKGKCICYVKDPVNEKIISDTNSTFLQETSPEAFYTKLEGLAAIPKNADILNTIFELWDKSDFTPLTQFVTPENLEEKVYKNSFSNSYTKKAALVTPTVFAEPDAAYIKAASEIKWLTEKEANDLTRPAILLAVSELSEFYYDDAESMGVSAYSDVFSDEELVEEYFNLKEFIQLELAEAGGPVAQSAAENTPKTNYEKSILLAYGCDPQYIETADPLQISEWYNQLAKTDI